MKLAPIFAALALGILVPTVWGTHNQGCVPTRADPSTTYVIDLPNGQRFYLEERAGFDGTWFVDPPTSPAPPGWGFLFGGGTWMYEETNSINPPEGSEQRGGISQTGSCFPPPPFPCLIIDEDPINDANCGHGADAIIF